MDAIKLGKFLAQLRNEKKMTQAELAEKLYVDSNKISRWECGNSTPDFDSLIKMSEIFKVTLFELSICKRLEDKTLLDKTKDKLRTLKDLKRIDLKRKVLYFIAVLFGIMFGLTTLYTIENYNTINVYDLKSLDKDFSINGSYIKGKDYESLNIYSIGYLGDDEELLKLKGRNIHYEILNYKNKLIKVMNDYNSIISDDFVKITDTLASYKITDERIEGNFKNNDELFFMVLFDNEKNEYASIKFNFKFVEKYNNRF